MLPSGKAEEDVGPTGGGGGDEEYIQENDG